MCVAWSLTTPNSVFRFSSAALTYNLSQRNSSKCTRPRSSTGYWSFWNIRSPLADYQTSLLSNQRVSARGFIRVWRSRAESAAGDLILQFVVSHQCSLSVSTQTAGLTTDNDLGFNMWSWESNHQHVHIKAAKFRNVFFSPLQTF